jgi:surfeit locus 1 family protein
MAAQAAIHARSCRLHPGASWLPASAGVTFSAAAGAMLQRLRQAGLVWPTLATLVGLAVLIGLGTWQLERKRWKEGLLAKIAASAHADPVPLSSIIPRGEKGQVVFVNVVSNGDPEYLHVSVRGRFRHDKEQYLYVPAAGSAGWHVYTPLQIAPGQVVWINRGFVPDAKKTPATRPEGQVTGEVEVRGLVRLPAGKGLFTPDNDVAGNLWYWPDIPAMTAAAFPEGLQKAPGGPPTARAWPLVIEADAQPAPPGGLPKGGVTRLNLPNRHLEYAVTWYGLALTLIGVYLAFAVGRLRAPGGD